MEFSTGGIVTWAQRIRETGEVALRKRFRNGDGARWDEDHYTAVGFPRIFYLKYHGYSAYFPLWALARYRNLRKGNRLTTAYGM